MATNTPAPADEAQAPSPWTQVAVSVALLTVIISTLLTAFAWPAVRTTVQDVPIAVAGPAAAADRVVAALEQRQPGAFDITRVADTAAAEAAVRDRAAYGAIDVSGSAPQVIVASAASSTIAQALQSAGATLAQATSGAPAAGVTVRDVAPLPADDPRGVGLSAGALPLVMGGLLAALLLTTRLRGTSRRLAGALGFAVTGGLAMAAILQFWFGSLSGSYLANAGVVALSIAATSLTVLGLESFLGYPGFAIGGVLMMLIGNPLSANGNAPQMLPGWSGELGQLLPPGAAGTLLRSTAFFDGNGAAKPVTVLAVWLVAGLLLCVVAARRVARRPAPAGTAAETPATGTASPVASHG
ncbi:hypothetical protein [Micromonospora sp. RTGN7]|uniref:hypothetical protein n=1 Tax=Micromonospora sp. RTGN7 TaxID=3016526 RepID=UPI0029FF329D|nr:hypothetical protein [Micromonospora sp. RTGN7]